MLLAGLHSDCWLVGRGAGGFITTRPRFSLSLYIHIFFKGIKKMLVLTRKDGEQVTIKTDEGKEILLKFRHSKRGKIQVGIQAPQEFLIMRNEIIDKNQKYKK
jgi:carbon storage regulator CsrA